MQTAHETLGDCWRTLRDETREQRCPIRDPGRTRRSGAKGKSKYGNPGTSCASPRLLESTHQGVLGTAGFVALQRQGYFTVQLMTHASSVLLTLLYYDILFAKRNDLKDGCQPGSGTEIHRYAVGIVPRFHPFAHVWLVRKSRLSLQASKRAKRHLITMVNTRPQRHVFRPRKSVQDANHKRIALLRLICSP